MRPTLDLFRGCDDKKRQAPGVAFLLMALSLAAAGCGRPGADAAGEAAVKPAAGHAGDASPSRVELTPRGAATAGLEFAVVARRAWAEPLRFPAEVGYNLKTMAAPAARAAGRVEKILAFPGDRVTAGRTLMLIYSPDFLALQAELLQAARQAAGNQADAGRKETWDSILNAARNRLRLLDISEAEVEAIEKKGRAEELLPVKAPVSGTVIGSLVSAGDHVEAGAPLLKLADLSTVWLEVKVFEKDLARVHEGVRVEVRAAAFPEEAFSGRLVLLSAELDRATRTAAGRVEVGNRDGRLRPGMFCEAFITPAASAEALFVPAAAVHPLDGRTVVFVPVSETVFEARDVERGRTVDGLVEVTGGLAEGERVATRGSFLLKSELLKSALGEEGHHHD
jgi:RND family efflux transporter MFP subunit